MRTNLNREELCDAIYTDVRVAVSHRAQLKDEERLTRLLLGYQIAYLILSLIGFRIPKLWHN